MNQNPNAQAFDPETGEILETAGNAIGGGRTAGDLISAGSQLLQIRTKNQLMVAIQRPRDMKAFETKLLAMSAEAGEDFFYFIRYKDGTIVEGAGVGLARAAAQLWGNCSVDTRIEQEAADAFLVRSDFVDFETNYTRSETKRVSKLMPRKGGGYVKAADKQLDLVYQQGASKVERDCILRSLPKHVVERAFEMAKAAALQEKAPIPQQIARILRRFAELNVPVSKVEAYIGCPLTEEGMRSAEKDPRDTCASLRGLITAIKGGDTTIEEAFGAGEPSQQAAASQRPGAIQVEDVTPLAQNPAAMPAATPQPTPPGNGEDLTKPRTPRPSSKLHLL
jgi:hypothetical protein